MKRWNRRAVVAAVLLAVGVAGAGADAEEAPAREGVFIHLSAGPDQGHRVVMALKMAVLMAEGGRDVLVYGDIEAVKVLVKGAPEVKHKSFETASGYLAKLAALGVPVRACPSCLAAAGKNAGDLLPGVKPADGAEFFSFTKGRILSLDY